MRSGCGAADEWQQLRDDSEEHAAVVADSEVGGDVAAHLRIAAAVGGQRSERQKFSGLSIDAGGGGGRPVPSAVPSWPIRSALCGALPVTAGCVRRRLLHLRGPRNYLLWRSVYQERADVAEQAPSPHYPAVATALIYCRDDPAAARLGHTQASPSWVPSTGCNLLLAGWFALA